MPSITRPIAELNDTLEAYSLALNIALAACVLITLAFIALVITLRSERAEYPRQAAPQAFRLSYPVRSHSTPTSVTTTTDYHVPSSLPTYH